ncbi:hypothetical protein ACJIZ3_020455 [Penstemon smallii]|uniref:PWWP domain-containing protein n=1 Tax=Penstemon smallii TaxID=265156 RepID=A0ABD3SJ24_9LAMI
MGSSGEEPNKGIDASVGGLIWVRRRNGSWWPGRVLGLDELPEGCLPTPRLGTPVKLLGREDASVDWYNLEKSKRVKGFWCSEFNYLIEKAKASGSNISKKTVKYARRDDAILHALELESARLGLDHPTDLSTNHINESPSSSHPCKESEEEEEEDMDNKDLSNSEDNSDSDSAPELSQSGVSFEDPNHLAAIKEDSRRCTKTPNDSDDDGTKGVKRMKGLEDLGMNVASTLKRKQSQVHEFGKRKHRRRALTKVLESTPVLSVPVPEASDSKVSELESKKNNSDSTGVTCENPTNTTENANDALLEIPDIESFEELFDVPLISEEKNSAGLDAIVSSASQKTQVGPTVQSSQSSHIETISLGNEEHNESGSTSSGTADDIHNITQILDKGTSKWQLKGKRNSRSRKMDMDDSGSLIRDGDGYHVKSKPITEIQTGLRLNAHTRGSTAAPQRLLPYRQSRFTVNPKYDSSDFSLRHHFTSSGLYDVPVEMQRTSQPQKVPCISLMSKFNGRPIIGHPLAVEVLDNGSCDDLLSVSECYNSSSELDHLVYVRKPTSKNGPLTKSPKLSKKTRKLSSLTGLNRQSQEEKKPIVEKLKGPSVDCVPIKVVFSRINAALNNSNRFAPPLTSTECI